MKSKNDEDKHLNLTYSVRKGRGQKMCSVKKQLTNAYIVN